jgi:hypothetical protein
VGGAYEEASEMTEFYALAARLQALFYIRRSSTKAKAQADEGSPLLRLRRAKAVVPIYRDEGGSIPLDKNIDYCKLIS